jgi:hypothetical protein
VQAHADAGMLFEKLDERQIGVFVGFFKHVAKIAAGLMSVYEQSKMEGFGHGDNFSHKHHTVWRKNPDSGDDRECAKGALF